MRYEDEAFIKSVIDEEMQRFHQAQPFSSYPFAYQTQETERLRDEDPGFRILAEAQARMIDELRARLEAANATVRSANARVEKLKAAGVGQLSNPDFAILGLDPNTAFVGLSEEEIQMVLQSAYRVRARLNHPDHGGEGNAMKAVNVAYEKLKNFLTRGKYCK